MCTVLKKAKEVERRASQNSSITIYLSLLQELIAEIERLQKIIDEREEVMDTP